MKELIRNLIAALAGALTGIFLLTASQIAAGALHPLPEGIDRTDKAAMAEFIGQAPAQALLVILAGYFVGVTAGTWVAGRISFAAPVRQALMVGGLFLVASFINLSSFPYPVWFWFANIALVLAATWLGIKLQPKRRA